MSKRFRRFGAQCTLAFILATFLGTVYGATRINTQDVADLAITNGKLAGGIASSKLANTAVTAGAYTNASVTFNAQGQAISASSGTAVPSFSDNEVPSGTIDGVNATFTLAHTPVALHLYKNGMRQSPGGGADYTLSGLTITFIAGNLPQAGDILLSDYRY